MTDLKALLERVKRNREADNALDIAIDISLFEPDEDFVSVRANAAGTKLVYTDRAGKTSTYWATDWTLDAQSRAAAAGRLTALIAKDAQQ